MFLIFMALINVQYLCASSSRYGNWQLFSSRVAKGSGLDHGFLSSTLKFVGETTGTDLGTERECAKNARAL